MLQINDTVVSSGKIVSMNSTVHNIWFWVAIMELIILLVLLFRKSSKNNTRKFDESILEESKRTDVDMNNIVNSIYKSKSLYDKLKVKCHPDRFSNSDLYQTADTLFQEITQNQRNYKKLLELQETAEKELKIKI